MASDNLKILIESHIPFVPVIPAEVAQVTVLPPEEITPDTVRDKDIIVVRTRTRCGRALLAGSSVKMVCTATIGTDHLDIPYLEDAGIAWANAPGCNAPAVAQYVFASIVRLINRPVEQYTIGIVGAGHVGSLVEKWARALDMRVLVCDPPRASKEGTGGFTSLEEIAVEADIITFHTPLTLEGDDATFHLAGRSFFGSLRRAPIIINAARGAVVDTDALVDALDAGVVSAAVIDCWEGEPLISPELLDRAVIATPHIAGYSKEGKIRATAMVLDAIADRFALPAMKPDAPEVGRIPSSVKVMEFESGYDPMADTRKLKSMPDCFEQLRDGYTLRGEARGARID